MPIVGFKCPIERTEVPFNHFETCTAKAGGPAFNPVFARIIARKIQGDVRHSTLKLTGTRVTGCPRATFIETQFPHYVDPNTLCASYRGTVLHAAFAEAADPKYWITESNDPVRTNLSGVLYGVSIDMMVDAIRRDLKEIVDYKFPLDWSIRYRGQQFEKELPKVIPDAVVRARFGTGTCKPEYAVQLNEARLLLAQQEWAIREGYDKDNTRLTSWDFALGQGGQGGPAALKVPYLTEDEMAEMHPYGGDATVAEIIRVHGVMVENHEAGADRDEHAAAIPLIGETQMNGKKCTLYCESEGICSMLVRKYGRPGA